MFNAPRYRYSIIRFVFITLCCIRVLGEIILYDYNPNFLVFLFAIGVIMLFTGLMSDTTDDLSVSEKNILKIKRIILFVVLFVFDFWFCVVSGALLIGNLEDSRQSVNLFYYSLKSNLSDNLRLIIYYSVSAIVFHIAVLVGAPRYAKFYENGAIVRKKIGVIKNPRK